MVPGVKTYLQRPEVIESFFILYRLTGNTTYQEWGWQIFESMERHCKVHTHVVLASHTGQHTPAQVDAGYSGLVSAMQLPVELDDTQQSFLLAETFKYLYLLFSPPDMLPLDAWVLNTEAHPLRIMHPQATN